MGRAGFSTHPARWVDAQTQSGQSTASTSRFEEGRASRNQTREEKRLKRNSRKRFEIGILVFGLLWAAGTSALAKNLGTITLLHDAVLRETHSVEWIRAAGMSQIKWGRCEMFLKGGTLCEVSLPQIEVSLRFPLSPRRLMVSAPLCRCRQVAESASQTCRLVRHIVTFRFFAFFAFFA